MSWWEAVALCACISLAALQQGRDGCQGLMVSGLYSKCGEKAEPCSWAASLGDAKSQPKLFTTVLLSHGS